MLSLVGTKQSARRYPSFVTACPGEYREGGFGLAFITHFFWVTDSYLFLSCLSKWEQLTASPRRLHLNQP